MFDDEDEFFEDRDAMPESILIQASAVAASVLLVAVCVWLGVK